MSRAVKVDDSVYIELDSMRLKGETFSQVIAGLLSTRVSIFELINTLEGQVQYHAWREKRLKELEAAVAGRDS
jgi:predicted CopG family antitoxin